MLALVAFNVTTAAVVMLAVVTLAVVITAVPTFAVVTLAVVTVMFVRVTLPVLIVTLASVRPSSVVAVLPSGTVVVPKMTLALAR